MLPIGANVVILSCLNWNQGVAGIDEHHTAGPGFPGWLAVMDRCGPGTDSNSAQYDKRGQGNNYDFFNHGFCKLNAVFAVLKRKDVNY